MNSFSDIHCHLLPGVDDGAKDIADAMEMLAIAYEDGIRTIVFTPHYRGRYKKNTPEQLRKVFFQLRQCVAEAFPDMRLYLGQEIAYEQDAPSALQEQRALTLGDSDYCLLEFSPDALGSRILSGVAETLRYGYWPIVAHAERCMALRKDPSLVDEILHMGGFIQLNADSVMGRWGFRVKHFCGKLLKEEKAHFIATDAHDAKDRPPKLRDCWQKVSKKYGNEYAARLFESNVRAVTENEPIE